MRSLPSGAKLTLAKCQLGSKQLSQPAHRLGDALRPSVRRRRGRLSGHTRLLATGCFRLARFRPGRFTSERPNAELRLHASGSDDGVGRMADRRPGCVCPVVSQRTQSGAHALPFDRACNLEGSPQMRRNISISVFTVALGCAASLATAQSTQSQPAGVANPQSQGQPRIPANRGTSDRQSGMGSSASVAASAAPAASSARSKNARLPTVRKQGAASAPRS
jgi:hypothetical protein